MRRITIHMTYRALNAVYSVFGILTVPGRNLSREKNLEIQEDEKHCQPRPYIGRGLSVKQKHHYFFPLFDALSGLSLALLSEDTMPT